MQAKFSKGQIVITKLYVYPIPTGTRLAVVGTWKQGGVWRYELEELTPSSTGEKRKYYLYEDVLDAPS